MVVYPTAYFLHLFKGCKFLPKLLAKHHWALVTINPATNPPDNNVPFHFCLIFCLRIDEYENYLELIL